MRDHEVIRYLLLRNGITYGELFPAGSAPVLTMDRSGEIKMSMQGEFLADAIDTRGLTIQVDWGADEIKPVLISDGEEHSLGILMPCSVTENRTDTADTITIQAFDRCWRHQSKNQPLHRSRHTLPRRGRESDQRSRHPERHPDGVGRGPPGKPARLAGRDQLPDDHQPAALRNQLQADMV